MSAGLPPEAAELRAQTQLAEEVTFVEDQREEHGEVR